MIVGGLVSGDREGVGRWVAGGGGRRPPAVLLSLPTAIEKVKHTPTRGHVTSREKDRVRELPSFLSPQCWHTYVTCTFGVDCTSKGPKKKGGQLEYGHDLQPRRDNSSFSVDVS